MGLLIGGLAAIAAAAGLLWWRNSLRDDWQSDMRASLCSSVRGLPDVGLQVWGAVALSLVAVLLFTVHAWRAHRRTSNRAGCLRRGAPRRVGVGGHDDADDADDANDGLDGSGLPCPSSM